MCKHVYNLNSEDTTLCHRCNGKYRVNVLECKNCKEKIRPIPHQCTFSSVTFGQRVECIIPSRGDLNEHPNPYYITVKLPPFLPQWLKKK